MSESPVEQAAADNPFKAAFLRSIQGDANPTNPTQPTSKLTIQTKDVSESSGHLSSTPKSRELNLKEIFSSQSGKSKGAKK